MKRALIIASLTMSVVAAHLRGKELSVHDFSGQEFPGRARRILAWSKWSFKDAIAKAHVVKKTHSCGCEQQNLRFCNYDGGNIGRCEYCPLKGQNMCDQMGLSARGVTDCKEWCIGPIIDYTKNKNSMAGSCGCEKNNEKFCNYDDETSGSCETCPRGGPNECDQMGLLWRGADDCRTWCTTSEPTTTVTTTSDSMWNIQSDTTCHKSNIIFKSYNNLEAAKAACLDLGPSECAGVYDPKFKQYYYLCKPGGFLGSIYGARVHHISTAWSAKWNVQRDTSCAGSAGSYMIQTKFTNIDVAKAACLALGLSECAGVYDPACADVITPQDHSYWMCKPGAFTDNDYGTCVHKPAS